MTTSFGFSTKYVSLPGPPRSVSAPAAPLSVSLPP